MDAAYVGETRDLYEELSEMTRRQSVILQRCAGKSREESEPLLLEYDRLGDQIGHARNRLWELDQDLALEFMP